MLKDILEEKKCFKLICGAGNEDLDEVEKLVALYSKAGCRFFDLSANQNVLQAAQKGLDYSVPKDEQADYHFCVSVGIQGEPHLNKAKININSCNECKKCVEACLQGAIGYTETHSKPSLDLESRLGLRISARVSEAKLVPVRETTLFRTADNPRQPTQQQEVCTVLNSNPYKNFKIHEEKCIGCLRCLKVCNSGAIEIYQKNKPINEILDSLLTLHPSPFTCLELHASGEDEQDVNQRWQYLNQNFDGMLSICIDRSKLGNEAVLKRIKNLIKGRKPYTTIIQADGAPMSGGEDDFKTTLQAVAMAEVFQKSEFSGNIPVYILLSGGTNSKTAQLAKQCGIDFHGVSVGSYARKIVKKYIKRDDFLQNQEVFNEALKIAKNLVNSSINSL